jgi:hypothetical protein
MKEKTKLTNPDPQMTLKISNLLSSKWNGTKIDTIRNGRSGNLVGFPPDFFPSLRKESY